MKTCIFGGTFDPPHIGHLLIAQTIIESENFDRLIFFGKNLYKYCKKYLASQQILIFGYVPFFFNSLTSISTITFLAFLAKSAEL